jgi:hypothetical protein
MAVRSVSGGGHRKDDGNDGNGRLAVDGIGISNS